MKCIMKVEKNFNWEIPDFSREKPRRAWDPSRKLLLSIRDYQRSHCIPFLVRFIFSKWCVLRHRFWSAVCGADIPLNSNIGGGLLIPHPNGIVIHPSAVIGVNCLIFQQVTLAGKVTTGCHVDIGAGAKILGPLQLGDHVKVGANAVVTKNVSSYATVVGIPAKPL